MYAPVAYHVWRAGTMSTEPASPVPDSKHTRITDEPHVSDHPASPAGGKPQRSTDWPAVAMQFIDVGLAEGWYSFRVSRHRPVRSPQRAQPSRRLASVAATTRTRPPWYYDENLASDEVKPHAVALLDKLPPPPPTGVEATALDPEDTTSFTTRRTTSGSQRSAKPSRHL